MREEIIIIAIAVVFVAAIAIVGYYFLATVKEFIINEQKKTLLEIKKIGEQQTAQVVTPVRLQAYERLVMFLERIKPDNLVLRCYQPNMDTRLLRDVMIKNIRDEYEHNLSQQLYISNQAWVYIKNAKEEIINTLNSITPKQDEPTSPTAFAGKLFELLAGKQTQIDLAQNFLKKEIQENF